MNLNKKNDAKHRRAQELVRLAKRLLKLGRECAGLPVLDKRTPEEMLYDESGLPK